MKVAQIVTFYRRPDDVPRMAAVLRAQTRWPDELWLMHEESDMGDLLRRQDWMVEPRIVQVPVPRDGDGQPLVIPFSPLLNAALDATTADAVMFVCDDSTPYPRKLEKMAAALEEHPEWGAVYCWQRAELFGEMFWNMYHGTDPVRDGVILEHCAVLHRRARTRWALDMALVNRTDGYYYWQLARELGPIYAVPELLDDREFRPDGITRGFRLGHAR